MDSVALEGGASACSTSMELLMLPAPLSEEADLCGFRGCVSCARGRRWLGNALNREFPVSTRDGPESAPRSGAKRGQPRVSAYQEYWAWRACGGWPRRPLPLVPAVVIRTRESVESNQELLLANWRLSRRLLSLSPDATQLVVVMLGWCCGPCRTFLEYRLRRRAPRVGRRQMALSR